MGEGMALGSRRDTTSLSVIGTLSAKKTRMMKQGRKAMKAQEEHSEAWHEHS